MRVVHRLPRGRRASEHATDGPCWCIPRRSVTARPGAQPAVVIDHTDLQPIPKARPWTAALGAWATPAKEASA